MDRGVLRTLLAGSLIVLVAACSGPTASGGPTGSPVATLTSEASPSPAPVDTATPSVLPSTPPLETPEPTENPDPCSHKGYDGPWDVGPLLPGSAVEVVVAELNLRAGPCTGAKRVATLKRGDILIVGDSGYGPFKGNGFPWYSVTRPNVTGADGGLPPLPLPPVTYEKDLVGGWIAANDGSKPFVLPVAPRCPATIDLANVRGMLPAERLACFETSFVLQGTFGCGGCGGTGGPAATPAWLATGFEAMNLRTRWDLDEIGRASCRERV